MNNNKPHRKRLHRYEIPKGIRFLTFSCRHRLQLFNNHHIKDAFIGRLHYVHEQSPMELIAWVIMPEHVHLLIRPTDSSFLIPDYLLSLKSIFAKQVLARWKKLNAPILDHLIDRDGHLSFWQPGGGYDRNVISSDELIEKINYIHLNPVRRGLVEMPADWQWSSALFYLGKTYQGPAITPVDNT